MEGLCEEKQKETRILRHQVLAQVQQNIGKWAEKEGCEIRFLESIYSLIIWEIQRRHQDFTVVFGDIRVKYLEYFDSDLDSEKGGESESGGEAPEKNSEALGSEDLGSDEC